MWAFPFDGVSVSGARSRLARMSDDGREFRLSQAASFGG
jgi:hypothetical protein